ncbi:hypothetical protein AAY84_12195 [Serratia marcescens]|uniref:hypothetical protein n=1 Tax=Serratia marcescens TaxID=615 RepID=UPI00062C29EF|nr:hypothetical protein [Serratia marcescens]KKZ18107.1 hypothetical protein AAY84_12195 [Serratia marcescens]
MNKLKEIQAAKLQKMVVVKGRTVRHDGKDYGQHAVISLSAQDAGRLQELGFVVSLESVRQALQDPADDDGRPDDEGAVGHNSDDAGDDTAGDAGGDDSNAGAADPDDAAPTTSNKPDSAKKGAK